MGSSLNSEKNRKSGARVEYTRWSVLTCHAAWPVFKAEYLSRKKCLSHQNQP